MKGTGATRETMMDLHEKNQQTDIENLNHFGKKSGHIICIVILMCIICD